MGFFLKSLKNGDRTYKYVIWVDQHLLQNIPTECGLKLPPPTRQQRWASGHQDPVHGRGSINVEFVTKQCLAGRISQGRGNLSAFFFLLVWISQKLRHNQRDLGDRSEHESYSLGHEPGLLFLLLILQQNENNSDGDDNSASLEIIASWSYSWMFQSLTKKIFQMRLCLHLKQAYLRSLTQDRHYFLANHLQMAVSFRCVKKGAITDFSGACIT